MINDNIVKYPKQFNFETKQRENNLTGGNVPSAAAIVKSQKKKIDPLDQKMESDFWENLEETTL